MGDTFSQYSRTANYYSLYRPRYPQSLIGLLKVECGFSPAQVIADIGSGTGQLTELLLQQGNPVFAIEPNAEMRRIAEQELSAYPRLTSLAAAAEATSLPDHGVDLITVGNAFHWFDHARTRTEFLRILAPHGWVVLAWNLKRNTGSAFAVAFEQFWQKHIDSSARFLQFSERKPPDYQAQFFGAANYKLSCLDNYQVCDLQALTGVVLSTLKAPRSDDPRYPEMLADLEAIFNHHQERGTVTLEYDTVVVTGQLSP